jgi:hypothetical protein
MNSHTNFLAIFIIMTAMHQYNFAENEELSKEAPCTVAPALSLREILQSKWNDTLKKQEIQRRDACKSALFTLANLEEIDAFIKANSITTIYWENRNDFSKIDFWFNAKDGSIRLDSPHLKELLKEAAMSYQGNTDFILFDKETKCTECSSGILYAEIQTLIDKKRKSLELFIEKEKCRDLQ